MAFRVVSRLGGQVLGPRPTGDSAIDGPAIQSLLDRIAADGGELRLRAGLYGLNQTLFVPSAVTLSGEGRGTVVRLDDDAEGLAVIFTPLREGLDVSPMVTNAQPELPGDPFTEGAIVRDIYLDGNGANQPARTTAGVMFHRGRYCQTIDVHAHNHGLFTQSLIAEWRGFGILCVGAEQCTIRGGSASRGAYENVGVRNEARNIAVIGVLSGQCRRCGIQAAKADHVVFANNVVRNDTAGTSDVHSGIVVHGSDHVSVTGNDIETKVHASDAKSAIWLLDGARTVSVQGNLITCDDGSGVGLSEVSQVAIQGNQIHAERHGISLHTEFSTSSRVVAQGNIISAIKNGVRLEGNCVRNQIKDNVIEAADIGVNFTGATPTNCQVTGNDLTNPATKIVAPGGAGLIENNIGVA